MEEKFFKEKIINLDNLKSTESLESFVGSEDVKHEPAEVSTEVPKNLELTQKNFF